MSMQIKVIDRLFERLELTYGAEWVRKWEKCPNGELKSSWAHELSHYANNLHAVAWALENLPEKCPNVIEFRNLCRNAPTPELPRLPEPKANPDRVASELSKLGELKKTVMSHTPSRGGVDWAKRIVLRSDQGEKIAPCVLRMAQEAHSQTRGA